MAPRIRRRITTAKREEIEKQQKALSQAIVRPFEVLSGLPVSYNPPPNGHYEDVLKNPLTTKDTGVLYRSLMKSRLNYMNMGPMFKLYWLKQSSYAKKMQQLDQEKNTYKAHKDDKSSERVPILGNDVSARDVMVKLCDASLSLGPHKFEIRLFIAKDERSEKNGKKKDEEDKVKKEPNSKEGLEEKESANSTNKSANSNNENDNIKETSVKNKMPKSTEEQDNQTNETFVNEERSKEENTNDLNNDIPKSAKSAQTDSNETQEVPNDQKNNSANSPPKEQDQPKIKPSTSGKLETITSNEGESDFGKKESSKVNSKKDNENQSEDSLKNTKNEKDSKKPKDSTTTSNVERITSNDSQIATLVQQPSSGDSSAMNPSSVSTPQNPSPTPPAAPKTDPNSMQSIENTIMIANLNTIARVDQSLNALMKIVALGNASPQQIITFQGYIQRAREMGPQPHHAYLFPNGILPNQRPRKLQKDRKPPKEKKPPKPKVPKDQKLTAFQEKYITDATLLFEFVENANVRYMLPQEAICEVLPPATFDAEEPDNKDILVSFLWIHNQIEVDNYNQKLKEYNEFKKKEEEELNKDKLKKEEDLRNLNQNEEGENNDAQKIENQQAENEQKPAHVLESKENRPSEHEAGNEDKSKEENSENQKNEEELAAKPSRRPPPRKGRRRRGGPVKKVAPKTIECPVEPEIKYTALSFTIHGIPSRYVPIIVNSFKKLEDVQERMSYILKNGSRTTSFYLWYQVDGKLDESIAEDIRIQLNQEEKKMQGVTSTQSSSNSIAKKRKQKDKGADPKPKKNKTDAPVSTPTPISVSAPVSSAPIHDSTQVSIPASGPTPTQSEIRTETNISPEENFAQKPPN